MLLLSVEIKFLYIGGLFLSLETVTNYQSFVVLSSSRNEDEEALISLPKSRRSKDSFYLKNHCNKEKWSRNPFPN